MSPVPPTLSLTSAIPGSEGESRPITARGASRGATPILSEAARKRFVSRVDRSAGPDACWPYTALRDKDGYGKFHLNDRHLGAHRVAYLIDHGTWPTENVLHSCDNPPCCNPAHLSPGTQLENIRQRDERGRRSRIGGRHHWRATRTATAPPRSQSDSPDLTPEQIARFWGYVARRGPDDCWSWTAGRQGQGYGCIAFRGVTYLAHRLAFFLANGSMPSRNTKHSCGDRLCCNPAHVIDRGVRRPAAGPIGDHARGVLERLRATNPLITVGLALAVLLTACTSHAEPRPNVVLVVLDDARLDDVAHLPSVQELAARGTTFARAIAPFSLCTPSRASILTGQLPATHGVRDNRGQNFDASSTIATWLQQAGYRTGLVGKYLNKPPVGGWPKPPGWDTWRPLLRHDDHGREQSRVLLEQALDFIETSDARPFFLLLSPAAPHGPNWGPEGICDGPFPTLPEPPNFDLALLGGPLEYRRWPQRLSALCGVDILIRGVLDAVPENTVVVVTSDQGYSLGEHGWVGKDALYDEVIRVPLIVAGPGWPHQVLPRVVSLVDIAPTLAEIAGATVPSIEGRSLLGEERSFAPIESSSCTGKRRARSKVTWCDGVTRTYDLTNDPFEMSPVVVEGQ